MTANAALVLVVTAVLVSIAYRSRALTTNIDGISYMSIARQYATGHPADAVNAYWSPLVSWMMAPFITAGLSTTTAFMVTNVVTCVAILVVGAWMVLRFSGSGWVAAWVTCVTAPVLVANVARETPDLLVVLWFLGFVWALARAHHAWAGRRSQRIAAGVFLGLVCVFGYFAKLYVVPVIVVVLPIWLVVRAGRGRGRRARAGYLVPAVAVATMAVVAAPWVIALSAKYDGPTVGSSFGVNISGKFDATSGDGTETDYFVPVPPNAEAVSSAEDRTPAEYEGNALTAPRTVAPPVEAAADDTETDADGVGGELEYYLQQRLEALPWYLRRIGSFAAFALPIGAAYAAVAVAGLVRFRTAPVATTAALTTAVYALGYAMITTAQSAGGNARYYLPLLSGTLLMSATLLPAVWRALGAGRPVRRVLVVLACVLVAVASCTQNVLGIPEPFSTTRSTTSGAAPLAFAGPTEAPDDVALVTALRDGGALPPGARIIGNNARETFGIAWRMDGHAYGRSDQYYDWNDPSFRALLRSSPIQYYLQFRGASSTMPDYAPLGTPAGSVQTESTCADDTKGADTVPCIIDVIRIDH